MSLLEAVRREAVKRIHNGETTERALAKGIGLSQPHIQHVLKGARTSKPEVADLLTAQLRISAATLSVGVGEGFTKNSCLVYPAKRIACSGAAER